MRHKAEKQKKTRDGKRYTMAGSWQTAYNRVDGR